MCSLDGWACQRASRAVSFGCSLSYAITFCCRCFTATGWEDLNLDHVGALEHTSGRLMQGFDVATGYWCSFGNLGRKNMSSHFLRACAVDPSYLHTLRFLNSARQYLTASMLTRVAGLPFASNLFTLISAARKHAYTKPIF